MHPATRPPPAKMHARHRRAPALGMAPSCGRGCVIDRVQDAVQLRIHASFYALGSFIVRRPLVTIVLAVAAALACASGLAAGRWESRIEYSYLPRSIPSFATYERQLELYGAAPRVEEFKAEPINPSDSIIEKRFLRALLEIHDEIVDFEARAPSGKAVAFEDICEELYKDGPCVVDNVLTATGLEDRRDLLKTMDQQQIDDFIREQRDALERYLGGVDVDDKDKSISVRVARFYYLVRQVSNEPQPLFGASDQALAERLAWEERFIAMTNKAEAEGMRLMGIAGRTLDDEVARNVQSSTPIMGAAISSILVYMVVLLGGRAAVAGSRGDDGARPARGARALTRLLADSARGSRALLGVGAVVTILLAEAAGFGLSCALGVPLTDISLMIVFIVVGVGVDDAIVVVEFVRAEDPSLPVETRVPRALASAGSAVFLTSFTNLIAFCVASWVDFPGVRWFCIAAGIVVFVLFVLTVTLFTALLVLDERRAWASRWDCCPCCGGGGGSCCCALARSGGEDEGVWCHVGPVRAGGDGRRPPQPVPGSQPVPPVPLAIVPVGAAGAAAAAEGGKAARPAAAPRSSGAHGVFRRGVEAYARVVTRPAVAVVVVLAALSLVPVGFVLAVPRLKIGVEFEDNFPDGSYLSEYWVHTDEHYEGLADSALLLFEGEDWAEEGVQERVLKMLDELDEYDDITTDFSAWLRDYDHYVSTREALIEAKLDNGTAPRRHGDGFFRDLGKWLEKEEPQCSNDNCTRFVVPRAYTKDIVWRGEGDDRRIFATRFRGGIRTPDTLQGRVDTMRAFRRKVEAERDGLRVTPWAYYFMFSDRDAIISTLIFETLGFAAAAVLGSLLFFLHVLTVGVIAAGIACVDGGLFVVMWVWDVPLDVSAFICLAISIGLAVDYVVHVAHAFEHSPGTPPERAQAALVEIGGAVFKGGMSTFLGIVLLAASSAEVFRIFFKMLFSTVLLALFIGLALFPALASLIGALIPSKTAAVAADEAGGRQDDDEGKTFSTAVGVVGAK